VLCDHPFAVPLSVIWVTTKILFLLLLSQPDMDEDKGDFHTESAVPSPDNDNQATVWVGGSTMVTYPSMVVFVSTDGAAPISSDRARRQEF